MFEIIKKMFAFSGERKGLLKQSLLHALLNGLFSSLQLAALFFTINVMVTTDKRPQAIWVPLVLMIISIAGRIIFSYFSIMEQTNAGYSMVADKRIKIGNRLQYIPMGYFNRYGSGAITALVTTTLGDVEHIAARILVTVLGGCLNSIALVFVLLFWNWQIGLIAAIGVILYLVTTEISQKRSSIDSPLRQQAQQHLVQATLEYIKGMTIVKTYGLEQDSNQTIVNAIDNSCDKNLRLTYSSTPYTALQQLVIKVASTLLILVPILFYLERSISIADAIVLIIASFMVFGELEAAGNMTSLLQMISSSMDEVNEIDQIPVMDLEGQPLVPPTTDLVFDHVTFSYGERKIINNLSFQIPARTTTAIVGPSGSGKSTLCNLIARFWDVDQGAITLGGINIKDYTLDSLMQNISMVFQRVYLFADTIENNIKFGNPAATDEQVMAAAKAACCHDFICQLPNGYQTIIGENGGTLSGGEKQRISIARAMIKNAPIILLDEATANIDPENEADLQKAIDALTHDKTIVIIAHRLKTVRNADQILVLADGEIVQQGTHHQLIAEAGLYADFINIRKEAVSWKLV